MKNILLMGFVAFLFLSPSAHLFAKTSFVRPVDPATEIAPDFERISWRVTGLLYGKDVSNGNVPLYQFNEKGLKSLAGTIPVGTSVKLIGFTGSGGVLYYSMISEEEQGNVGPTNTAATDLKPSSLKWIAGYYLEPTGTR